MNESHTLHCGECPFGTNPEGRICRTAVVPALALLIRDEVIDRTIITDKPEDLLHGLRSLAPVQRAAQMACNAVFSVTKESDYQAVG